jgi:hypothetical protein
MIGQLRAFAWLRWRMLLNRVRGTKRRDTMEQAASIIAMVAPALVVVMSLGSVTVLAVAGWYGGRAIARGGDAATVSTFILRIILVVQLVIVTVMPLGLGAQSASRKTRLLLLPISRRLLHALEVLGGIADPWIFAVVPGLVLLVFGILAGGAFATAAVAAAVVVGMALLLLSLSALASFLVQWLMRDRRRAEVSTLLFVFLLSLAGFVPQMFALNRDRDRSAMTPEERRESRLTVEKIEAAIPSWARVLPSEMAGLAIAGAARGDIASASGWVGGLWVATAAVWLASAQVHRRLLNLGDSVARRSTGAGVVGLRRVPWVSPAVSAIAAAQWRTAIRSVRGRLAILMPGPIIAVLLVVITRSGDVPWADRIGEYSHLACAAAATMALMTVHPFTLNQFATDRAGLTLQFLLPISARQLAWGKALGTLALYAMSLCVGMVAVAISSGVSSLWLWASVVCGALAAFLLQAPFAAMISALLPSPSDLNKTGSAGNPHAGAALVGILGTMLAVAPILLIVLIIPAWSRGLTLLASAVWLLVAALIARALLTTVSRTIEARRENLLLTIR